MDPAADPRATQEMPFLVPVADEVAHDEEVAHEPRLLDNLQLKRQPVHHPLHRRRHGGIAIVRGPVRPLRALTFGTSDVRIPPPALPDSGLRDWTRDFLYVGSLRASSTPSTTNHAPPAGRGCRSACANPPPAEAADNLLA